jgi:hypothetical protein
MSRSLLVILLAAACGKVNTVKPDAAPDASTQQACDTTHVCVTPTKLTVMVTGNGHVTAAPGTTDCGGACTETYERGAQITLTATGYAGASLTGWNGACSGTQDCTFQLESDTSVSAAFGCSGMVEFDYTGAPQSWSPPCTTTINVDVRGAGGGIGINTNPTGTPSLGGRVQASLAVQTTDVLEIYVGGVGTDSTATAPGVGGYNGGASGAMYGPSESGAGGGGATDIRLNGAAPADRVVIAGGAGGDSCCQPFQGGGGGGLIAGAGAACNGIAGAGGGGTQSGGGGGGNYSSSYCTAGAGTSGAGAPGCTANGSLIGSCGGGGGGGYFGGGGGSWGAGGGGSSYTSTIATNVIHTQGFQMGNGQVIISW